ncbi:hypothetical protein BG015_004865, partial [Linnemannia schmuckeri]
SYAHISQNDCRPIRIPGICFWMSQFVKKDYTPVYSIELNNIPDYVAMLAAPEAKLPNPESVRTTRSVRQEPPQPEPAPPGGAAAPTNRDIDARPEGHNHVNIGPSLPRPWCYRIVNDNAVSVHKPDQIEDKDPAETAEPVLLTLQLFGFGSDSTTTASETTLKKRAAAECVKGPAKVVLNSGETLATTDFVASEEGGPYRLVFLGSTGDVIVYDVTPWRTLAGVVLKYADPISAAGPAYQMTVSKTRAVYIKNEVTVVWTTGPRVATASHEIAGTALTESNSFKSLDSMIEPKALTSTNGKTTLELKDAQLCLYNSLKFQTWWQPGRQIHAHNLRLHLYPAHSRRTLSSSCSGNVGGETSYVAVVHDDRFLKIYNSAEELVWQRGGAQTLSDTNTLRAGGFKPILEEIKSPNGLFSLSTTETGGLVLRKTSDATAAWHLGGELAKGKYTIELEKDGNLCVGTASVHARVSCITGAAKKEDQDVLVVEDEGHVATLESDGSVAWQSS